VHAVLFDYGQTLVTYIRPDDALRRAYTEIGVLLGDRLGVPVPDTASLLRDVHDTVDERVAEHEATDALEEIDLTAAHIAAYAALGLRLAPDLADEVQRIEQQAWWSGMTLAPDAAATLRRLRARGLRLGLCSNAPYRPASMQAQLAHVGLDRLLDSATFSSAVGWRKPSPRLFEQALVDLGARASTTVVVGDRVREDIEGAHAGGMRAVLLREHRCEADPDGIADAVIVRLADLPDLLAS